MRYRIIPLSTKFPCASLWSDPLPTPDFWQPLIYFLSLYFSQYPVDGVLQDVRASQLALVVKSPPANARDPKDVGSICGFDPWVGKIPWSRKWQPTPVFLPGECHGQRSLVGCSPWGHKEWVQLSD